LLFFLKLNFIPITTLEKILSNRENKIKKIFNAIPYCFSKLNNYFPIFTKGTYAAITANPSVGKTQVWKSLVFSAIENCIQYNIDAKFIVCLLEESKHEFECSVISYLLNKHYGIRLGYLDLNSFTDRILTTIELEAIFKASELSKQYLEYFVIEDEISHPTGIFMLVKNYMLENNLIKKQERKLDDGKTVEQWTPCGKQHVIVIVDHVSELDLESGCPTLRDSMLKWNKYAATVLTKHYDCTVINIHQQQAAAENVEHLKNNRIVPSQDKLADAPVMSRSYKMILGIFYPARYGITEFLNYDITHLGNYFRSLHVIKNRFGQANIETGIFFDGACTDLRELPKPHEKTIQQVYSHIKNLQ